MTKKGEEMDTLKAIAAFVGIFCGLSLTITSIACQIAMFIRNGQELYTTISLSILTGLGITIVIAILKPL